MLKYRSEIELWYPHKVLDANELDTHDECWVNSLLAPKTEVQSIFHLNTVNSSYSCLINIKGLLDTSATIKAVKCNSQWEKVQQL